MTSLHPSSREDEFGDATGEFREACRDLSPVGIISGEREGHTRAARISETATRVRIAFAAACALVFEGRTQPNGYTEGLLRKYRLDQKVSSR